MAKEHLRIPDLSNQDIVRFHSKYTAIWPGGCWECGGSVTDHGHAVISVKRRMYKAARIAFFLFTGEDPSHLQVQHTCNNPACVCPLHLILGTYETNGRYMVECRRDMASRYYPDKYTFGENHWTFTNPEKIVRGKRHWAVTNPEKLARGERHYLSKLTESQVVDILSLHASGVLKKAAIARMFSISKSNCGDIIAGKTWRHVYLKFHSISDG